MSLEPDSNQWPKDIWNDFVLQSSALPTELSRVHVCMALNKQISILTQRFIGSMLVQPDSPHRGRQNVNVDDSTDWSEIDRTSNRNSFSESNTRYIIWNRCIRKAISAVAWLVRRVQLCVCAVVWRVIYKKCSFKVIFGHLFRKFLHMYKRRRLELEEFFWHDEMARARLSSLFIGRRFVFGSWEFLK